jgi:hypothetical protein
MNELGSSGVVKSHPCCVAFDSVKNSQIRTSTYTWMVSLAGIKVQKVLGSFSTFALNRLARCRAAAWLHIMA